MFDWQSLWRRCWGKFRGKETPTDRDILLLTPFHLYKTYHHFPFVVVLHVILLVFISVSALLLSSEYVSYGRSNEQLFEAIFLPDSIREDGLYDVPSILDLIEQVVQNYYAFPIVSLNRYEHLIAKTENGTDETKGKIMPVAMKVTQYKNLTGTFWNLPCYTQSLDKDITRNTLFNSSDEDPVNNSTSPYYESDEDFSDPETDPTSDTNFFSTFFDTSFAGLSGHDTLLPTSMTFDVSSLENIYFEIDDDEMVPADIEGDFGTMVLSYNLTISDTLGPLGGQLTKCELQHYLYETKKIELQFAYRSINIGSLSVIPYLWNIQVILEFEGGNCLPAIKISHSQLQVQGLQSSDIYMVMNSVLFVLSTAAMIQSGHSIYLSIKILRRTKTRYEFFQSIALPSDKFPTWGSLPFKVKPRFFSFWSVLNGVSSILLLISSIAGIMEANGRSTSVFFLAFYGAGCMLICVSALRYFEYFPLLYLHVRTLRNAAVHVVTYCISVVPVFWGFAVFGVLNFGPYSDKFSGVSQTIVTLFSLLNGDDIYSTFDEIESGQYPLIIVSRTYIFIFVTLFVTSVLNVFIFIIEDSYRQAKLTALNWPSAATISNGGDQITGPEDSFSSREILCIIFHNLSMWENRMKRDPDRYHFFAPEVTTSNQSWKSAEYLDESSGGSGSDIAISMSPMRRSPSDQSLGESADSSTNLVSSHERSMNSPPRSPVISLLEDDQDLHLLEDNVPQLFRLLQQQIASQRQFFDDELARKEEELRAMRKALLDQQAYMLNICKLITNSRDPNSLL